MADTAHNSTARFSDRVADYVRYRPGYPDGLVQSLCSDVGLSSTSIVADVGSGTGISAGLFLRLGCIVKGVEPNREMRAAAEAQWREEPRFHCIDGTAEATTLPSSSIDFVAAGQAFHWFDVARTRSEFARILRPGGTVALFWNTRRTETTEFLKAYELLLLEFATDYQQIDHRLIDSTVLKRFFGSDAFQSRSFPNSQDFDFVGLRGRLLSSSYAPAAGHSRHEPMLKELERLFEDHATGGKIQFDYDTELFFGPLAMNSDTR